MTIIRTDTQTPQKGPADYFTGDVTIEWQFARTDPARVAGALVSFAPGARSAWHTHPLGQTLIVVSGTGWYQCEGEAKEEVRDRREAGEHGRECCRKPGRGKRGPGHHRRIPAGLMRALAKVS